MEKTLLVAIMATALILVGCQKSAPAENANTAVNKETDQLAVNIANPASANCFAFGGVSITKENKKGQYGVCVFEENRQCEEWALLRGDCPEGGVEIAGYNNEAEIYCAITGGQIEGAGTETPMCKRPDGKLCGLQANLNNECPN